MYFPLNYDQITWIRGHYAPSSVKTMNNASYAYWERSLFQRMCSVIDFELPEDWQGGTRDFFYWCLFRYGFVCVAHEEEFGTFFQPCTLGGMNFFYQPRYCVVSNPMLNKTYFIGDDCSLIKLTPDYLSAWDCIAYFASKLATLDVSIDTNIINSKLAYILGAKNKATAEALKTIMDRVNKGEPAVFYDKALTNTKPTDDETPFQFLPIADLKNNYILDQLLREFQTIINQFDAEIGIPTVPYQKAERMVTDEANSKTADALSRLSVWTNTLDSSLKEVNKMFPELNISYTVRTEVQTDGNSENDPDRNDGIPEE